MATQTARGNASSSTSALYLGAIGLLVIGLGVMYFVPGGTMIGTFLVVAGVIVGVLGVLRGRRTPGDDHEEASPLHLRE